jgi:hypothetical protein
MTANLVNLRTIQFSNRFSLLSQTMGAKLKPYVLTGTHQGKLASPTNQISPTEMVEVTDRFAPRERNDVSVARRWVSPAAFEHVQMVDKFDELQMEGDIKPGLVDNAIQAAGRREDKSLLQAMFATAVTGETAGSTQAFGTTTTATTGQNVAVAHGAAAATSLTVAKLREVVRTFIRNKVDIDREQIWGVLDANTHDSLLGETQATSMDFNTKPVLEEGKIKRFMGINFVIIQEVNTICAGTDDASGSSTGIPFFVPSGMYLGIWQDINTVITQRHDLKLAPWQVAMDKMIGATRLEEVKVVRCWCR